MSPLWTPRPTDPTVILDESRYPGAFSVDYVKAGLARDAAVRDCYTDPTTGGITTRPRPLELVPCPRATSTNGKAFSYHWPTLDLAAIASNYGLGSSGDVRYRLHITSRALSTYDAVQVRINNADDFLTFPTGFNVSDLQFSGWTLLGRENMASTQNAIVVPSGRALKDIRFRDWNMQWFYNQLWGPVGRFYVDGLCNWNNAINRVVDVGGSDGSVNGQWYMDSRALPAGNFLMKLSNSSFRVGKGGQVYITPNSAGGLYAAGRVEGWDADVEVNGLGVQAPEYCTDTSQHVGTNLLGGSPSTAASAAPGLIFYDLTTNQWVWSNGTTWQVFYDGSAATSFDDTATSFPVRPATGVTGKVYQNMTANSDFSGGTGGTNTTIRYWVYLTGYGWRGPSYWNQAAVPTVAAGAGHVMTPVYIGCDAPGIVTNQTRGSGRIGGSVALCGLAPGIVNSSWTEAVEVIDAKDPLTVDVECSFVGGGRYGVGVRNSGNGFTSLSEVHSSVRLSQYRTDDLPAFGTRKVGTCRVYTGGVAQAWTTTDQAVPDDGTGITVSGLDVWLKPGERVFVDGWIDLAGAVGDATTAGDVTVTHTLPSGATHGLQYAGPPTGATGTNTSINQAVGSGVALGTFATTDRNRVTGWIQNGSTAGLYQIKLVRIATGASMPSVKAGSTMRWWQA